ncbi:MAG: MMPL family transporter [Prolixibacteraceae bacterium]|nr:MMPL family transporter [Prolixibacteraceae bacterium]
MQQEKFIVRNRWWFIITPVVLTIISTILLSKVKINSDLETYFPETMKSKTSAAIIEESFGKAEPFLILFESDDILKQATLKRLKDIDNELNRMGYFDEVISLFSMKDIRGDDGMMIVDPQVEMIPDTKESTEKLRESIRGNELAYRTVISDDFRYAMIILKITDNVDDQELIDGLRQLIDKYPGDEKVYFNGMSYLRYEANNKISRDLTILLPLALLVMIFFLFISFKEFRGVWLPITVVIVSSVVSMGMLPLLKWDLSIIGVLIPIMMIAIANNYGVHFVARYQELNVKHPRWSMSLIVLKTLQNLRKPIILTGLTTIVGILGLVTHLMIPARQMGVVSALGVGLALGLSLTFIPAIMSTMKKGASHKAFSENKNGIITEVLSRVAIFINHSPRKTITIFAVFLFVVGSGIFFLKVASNNDRVLSPKHPYNQSIQIANKHFGGTRFISVMFEGDMQDPELLKRLDYYESELKKMPETGNVNSLSTIMRIMSRALNDQGTEGYNAIPDSRDAIAQYLLLYSMSGDPDDFESIVNFDYTQGLLSIQFHADDMKTLNRVINKIETLTKDDPAKKVVAGFSLTEKEMAHSITIGQIYSLVFALFAIFLLLALIFKNAVAGAIGSLPLVFAVICTFGIMGITGIQLNIVTALLSSISIGVGVDYTIHIFWRLKNELSEGKKYPEAISNTLRTTGRGIVINAFSVILGFAVLYFSAFPYLKMFATLIILSLLLCLLCALVLVPAICMVAAPRFLGSEGSSYIHPLKSDRKETLKRENVQEEEILQEIEE